jgi:hypothetical protein
VRGTKVRQTCTLVDGVVGSRLAGVVSAFGGDVIAAVAVTFAAAPTTPPPTLSSISSAVTPSFASCVSTGVGGNLVFCPVVGGVTLTMRGSNLTGGVVSNACAGAATFVSDSELTCILARGLPSSSVTVSVTTSTGTSNAKTLTYATPAVLTALTATGGCAVSTTAVLALDDCSASAAAAAAAGIQLTFSGANLFGFASDACVDDTVVVAASGKSVECRLVSGDEGETLTPAVSTVGGVYVAVSLSPVAVSFSVSEAGYDLAAWSVCSKTCGGGTQTRSATCLVEGVVSDDADCAGRGVTAPIKTRACNVDACASYAWKVAPFSMCDKSCGGGSRSRAVTCVDDDSGNVDASGALCAAAAKPVSSEECNTAACASYVWTAGAYASCSLPCGGGVAVRAVVCSKLSDNDNDDDDDVVDVDSPAASSSLCVSSERPVSSRP